MKTKQKPVSLTQLFKQKKIVDKLEREYMAQKDNYISILKSSDHLSGKVATYNKKKYYVTISKDLWYPILNMNLVKE
jgi:hypothetical protein